MSVNYIPEGYHTITPYLVIKDAAKALDHYKQAFGAVELVRFATPEGVIKHAEMRIGDSRFMMTDEWPAMGARGPLSLGGTPVFLMLYVPDVDAVVAAALTAGAHLVKPVQDQFYGDRSGVVADPFGHLWAVATHKEDLTEAEIAGRDCGAAPSQSPPAA